MHMVFQGILYWVVHSDVKFNVMGNFVYLMRISLFISVLFQVFLIYSSSSSIRFGEHILKVLLTKDWITLRSF